MGLLMMQQDTFSMVVMLPTVCEPVFAWQSICLFTECWCRPYTASVCNLHGTTCT